MSCSREKDPDSARLFWAAFFTFESGMGQEQCVTLKALIRSTHHADSMKANCLRPSSDVRCERFQLKWMCALEIENTSSSRVVPGIVVKKNWRITKTSCVASEHMNLFTAHSSCYPAKLLEARDTGLQ
jgi:hypothetical protein